MRKANLLSAMLLCVGCSTEATNSAPEITHQINETSTELSIVGRDQAGAEVGRLTLTRGRFMMEDYGAEVDGRRFVIEVDGQTVTHEHAGNEAVSLPRFVEPELLGVDQFLQHPTVLAALASERIGFAEPEHLRVEESPTQAADVPYYDNCGYTPSCGASNCAASEYGHNYYNECVRGEEQWACCPTTVARRLCGMGAANPCGGEGPAGCKTCYSTGHNGYCNAYSIPKGEIRCTFEEYVSHNDIYVDWN